MVSLLQVAGHEVVGLDSDFFELRVLPEFQPEWNARLGARLYEAYQKVLLKVDDFEGSRSKRIDQSEQLLSYGRLDSTLSWRSLATA